jgi:hypothetical protein
MTNDALEHLLEELRQHPCYMLLAIPRTGSAAIWSALDCHPDMHWLSEIWAAESQGDSVRGWTVGKRLRKSWGLPGGGFCHTEPPEHVDEPLHPELWDMSIPHAKQSEGKRWRRLDAALKTFIWPAIWRLKDHIKVIRLDRRNEIARCVSGRVAMKCNIWQVWNRVKRKARQQTLEATRIEVDLEAVDRDIARRREHWRLLQEHFPDALELYYEDFNARPSAVFSRIFEYLGVSPVRVAPQVRKNPVSWKDRVLNYEELREHFRDRPEFDHCFEE